MSDTGGIRAGKAYVELGLDDKLSAGLKATQAKLRAFAAGVQSAGIKLAGLGGIALGGLLAAAKGAADTGAAFVKQSQTTGMSVESLSALQFAAAQTGASAEALDVGLFHMSRFMGELAQGSAHADEGLGKLGLTMGDMKNLKPEQQFDALADALSRLPSDAERAAVGQEIFGKGVHDLIPMLKQGKSGIEEFKRQAQAMGLVMSTEDAAAAMQLKGQMNVLDLSMKRVYVGIGSALVPALTELAKDIVPIITGTAKWARENPQVIQTVALIAAGVVGLGLVLIVLGKLSIVASAGFGLLSGAINLTSASLAALEAVGLWPVVLGLAAVALGIGAVALGFAGLIAALAYLNEGSNLVERLGTAIGNMVDTGKKGFQDLLGTFNTTWGGILDAIKGGNLALAAQIAWLGLQVGWMQFVNTLKKGWIDFKGFFVDTLESAVFAAAKGMVNFSIEVSVIWERLAAAIKLAIIGMVENLEVLLEKAKGGAGDVDAARARANARRGEVLSEAADREGKLRQGGDALTGAIDAKFGREQEARRLGRNAEKEAIDNDPVLAAKRAELDAARREAARAVELNAGRALPNPGGGIIPAARKTDVLGTFGSARGLGVGSSLDEQQVALQKQIAANTKRIADRGTNTQQFT